mmetsp:Transcript_80830/g.262093  ORF Transcript_80830/g.262093 Transcript_80830/m.262093 type:complete len:276 (-) Transcript_80830:227-1054(-)
MQVLNRFRCSRRHVVAGATSAAPHGQGWHLDPRRHGLGRPERPLGRDGTAVRTDLVRDLAGHGEADLHGRDAAHSGGDVHRERRSISRAPSYRRGALPRPPIWRRRGPVPQVAASAVDCRLAVLGLELARAAGLGGSGPGRRLAGEPGQALGSGQAVVHQTRLPNLCGVLRRPQRRGAPGVGWLELEHQEALEVAHRTELFHHSERDGVRCSEVASLRLLLRSSEDVRVLFVHGLLELLQCAHGDVPPSVPRGLAWNRFVPSPRCGKGVVVLAHE